MIKYVTVAREAEAEDIIEKSRFIAHIRRADSKEEAEGFIAEIRKKYKDATHNVPAFVIGEKQELQWASDDGEPSGTSGAPMLQMIVKEGLTNTVIVVTRYFGGIKLGTGGLVRAYTGVARKALDLAGRYEVKDMSTMKARIPYSLLTRIQRDAAETGYEISDVVYEDELILTLYFESEKEDIIASHLSDFSAGKIQYSIDK
ncbi:MAG: YigZ family protein [Firmicutes bacterium]|nr:YigZ family protein [Bacillota bacterium]